MNRLFGEAHRSAELERPRQLGGGFNLTLMLLAIAASAFAAVKLGQDVNWDLLNYHFYDGYAFLYKPLNYDFAPAQLQSFFNPLFHAVTYLMLAHLPATVAAATFGAIQGLNFCLIFLISQALFQRWEGRGRYLISLANAFTGFYGAVNISELGTTIGDNLVSVLTLAGLLLVIRYFISENVLRRISTFPLWIAGASLGAAAGLKLTLVIYAAATAISLTVLVPAMGNRLRSLTAFYSGLAIGFVAAYGFWGANLYLQYQSPVFPYLNNLFHSPYYNPTSTLDDRFLPRSWQHILFYPFFIAQRNHLVSELDFRDVRLALCYLTVVFLAGAALFGIIKPARDSHQQRSLRMDRLCLLFLTIFLVFSYIAWQHLFSIYRYQVVLEFLAPTFLTFTFACYMRNRQRALVFSLAINLGICACVISPNWGRQKFENEFLKVQIPAIRDLDKSVVLMAGGEATSYIVPRFPASTRFVRIYSNFARPGENGNLDERIRSMLAKYNAASTLVYVANGGEMDHTRNAVSIYGVIMDETACYEVDSHMGNKGYLCRAAGGWKAGEEKPPAPPWDLPTFQKLRDVRIEATPPDITAGRDTLCYRVVGMKARAFDMLYTIDGDPMPPVRGWPLEADQSTHIFVGAMTRKGLYHIEGIRASEAAHPNTWIQVDTWMRVK